MYSSPFITDLAQDSILTLHPAVKPEWWADSASLITQADIRLLDRKPPHPRKTSARCCGLSSPLSSGSAGGLQSVLSDRGCPSARRSFEWKQKQWGFSRNGLRHYHKIVLLTLLFTLAQSQANLQLTAVRVAWDASCLRLKLKLLIQLLCFVSAVCGLF